MVFSVQEFLNSARGRGRLFGVHAFMNTEQFGWSASMRTKQGSDDLAIAELAAVLQELGVECWFPDDPDDRADLRLRGAVLEVKSSSRPTIGQLERLGVRRDRSTGDLVPVLVADQLDPGARRALQDAGWGWLDRSGHLRLMAGPLQIDRPVPNLSGPDPTPPQPLARPTGLAVALELLRGEQPRSIRELAGRSGVSVGAAHSAAKELRDAHLLDGMRRRDPDLFWAVADHWHVRWFALKTGPNPGIPEATRRLLRMRFDQRELPGWAEVGDLAAQVYGARMAGDTPARLYLPDERALTWALRTWGEAHEDRSATASIAVAPVTNAVMHRRNEPTRREWPLAQPIVVALNLASDPSPRSREILDTWDTSRAEVDRVW